MLRRDNSEYQWFRERAASINTNLESDYPVVNPTSTMGSKQKHELLNPEPADPEHRAHSHLPPKSYADAAQEAADSDSTQKANGNHDKHINGNVEHGDSNGDSGPSTSKSSHDTNIGERLDEDKVQFEKYSNGNGIALTSVKPDPSYEENLKHNQEIAPRSREPSRGGSSRSKQKTTSSQQDPTKSQLKTGRQAGAGWEKSA